MLKTDIINLTISGISNLGQGFSLIQNDQKNRKIFVSKTVVGDEIEAKIVKENSKFVLGSLTKIIKKSPNRREAPCRYFSECGGCELQHLELSYYQNFKQKTLKDLLQREGIVFESDIEWDFVSEKSRRRVVFHVDLQNRLGFFRENSNDVVKIDECLILDSEISALIPKLQKVVIAANAEIQKIQITKFDNGIALIFDILKHPNLEQTNLLTAFAKENKLINLSYKIENDVSMIYQSEIPQLFFGQIKLDLNPDIFLQATNFAQSLIIGKINDLILKNGQKNLNLIDLYCGIGTYSFGILAQNPHIKISAFEGDSQMINLLNRNALKNNLNQNLKGLARDLVKNPLRKEELKDCDVVIINPPRNGALAQIQNINQAKIKNILYVSCSPSAFIGDAKILMQKGYKIKQIVAIDQFIYSHHLELVAIFER